MILQGQCGYSEGRQQETCFCDGMVESDEMYFPLLFVEG